MSEREYGVYVLDLVPDGEGEQIVPHGSRRHAESRVHYYQAINNVMTRPRFMVKVVYRYRFMPDMPWEDA